MKLNHYTITAYRNSQGVALLAALMLVVMFTIIGIQLAQRGKQTANITGATVRHDAVFEAAETTLRNAVLFVNNFDGNEPPLATTDGSQGRNNAANFNITNTLGNSTLWATDPSQSFIWESGALGDRVCGTGTNACPSGVDFVSRINNNMWTTLAIQSSFAGLDANNYIGNIQTYTFIEILRVIGKGKGLGDSNLSGTTSQGYYYLITVKASGYPPGVNAAADTSNARENVLVQAVYAQQF